MLIEPVAGLGDAPREKQRSGFVPNSFSPSMILKKRHAPMFSGSSCTQMTGVPLA